MLLEQVHTDAWWCSKAPTVDAQLDGAWSKPGIGFWQPARTSEQPAALPVY
ncbi:hypothetical protein [Streptomyces sp. NBC_01235]|uniref:hypothetical protein n=1 Tax=Streptomyces sp. NBC_01235 TaxID=2903788 RepID=UPI002E105E55|nr:hypothetical protein OG289_07060 [Streptomyces sp. NBC_01235]